MSATTRATWDAFLYEQQGIVVRTFAADHPWLAELNGVDASNRDIPPQGRVMPVGGNRELFRGRKVRHTIVPYGMQAGGFVAESGTWNVPVPVEADEVTLTLARFLQPFSLTVDVERDSMDNSSAKAVAENINLAKMAVAKWENIGFLGDGTGLLASSTSANSDSNGLTMTVGTTAANGTNWDVLLPGTIVDVLVKADGTDPGQGKRRLIASVEESAGTVTFSTTQQASDGGSGSITLSTNDLGIYMPGSYGNAPQGLDQAASDGSESFENLAKSNTFWKGTDGRGGDTDVLPISNSMLRKGVRCGRRWGVGAWDFGIGDPAAIDLYMASKESLVRYESQPSILKSGFKGIIFDGADKPFPLIKEPAHKKASLRFIRKSDFVQYGDSHGPEFLNDTGAMWSRFQRTLEKEADLLDRTQLGVTNCNSIIFFDDLDVES